MGYSSQVAYSIVFKDKRTLNEFIALVMLQGGYDVEALKECYIDWDNCQVHYHAWDIKWWYEVYPYVQGHNRLREFAQDRFEKECSIKFVRIGEELNDNEEEGHQGCGAYVIDDLHIHRRIETQYGGKYEPIGDALAVQELD